MNENGPRRPWGFYENLADEENHKVKRITVYPGKRLSLQSHERRLEHWFVIEGRAEVTLGERIVTLEPGEFVDIPAGEKHRVANTGDSEMVFIEIQTGTYFGEDDILRYEDDFGRV